MRNQIRLGRWFGVEIGLHLSWFIIAFLITLSVAQEFAARNRDWGAGVVWLTALLTGGLFFVTIILHELAHSLVAKSRGLPVKAITLFALGGVSRIEKDSPDAGTEFWIAIAGPLASLAIAAVCLGLARVLGWDLGAPRRPALALLVWLGYINFGLAVFNLVPGFPLDGGRVLRAALWRRLGDAAAATRLAARAGHWIAMLFIFVGVLQFFMGAGFNGLWLAFIGWFLDSAAQATALQTEWGVALKEVRVEDVMRRDCPGVPGGLDVETFVHEHLLRTGEPCWLVREDGHAVALLTAEDVKRAPKAEWPRTELRALARPFESLLSVPMGADAKTALEAMDRGGADQLAVVSGGRIEGILSRAQLLRLLQTKLELKA